MTAGGASGRGLVVLADGAQAAFAAGAVAALAEAGATWRVARGAGLGAQVALLAVLGESGESARRWRRQGELGCPLLVSQVESAAGRLDTDGMLLLPDPWGLAGWLDGGALDEHLLPEGADVPGRLRARGARCAVAAVELRTGTAGWRDLGAGTAPDALRLLRAAAAFSGGWGPVGDQLLAGGVGVAAGLDLVDDGATAWDVVCGFSVPAAGRPGLSGTWRDAAARRDEIAAAAAVSRLRDAEGVRVVAPAEASYRLWADRDGADLEIEWPLPAERNGELVRALVEYGAAAAGGL